MKKVLSVLLLCAMLLSLAACGSQNDTPDDQPQQAEPVKPVAPDVPPQFDTPPQPAPEAPVEPLPEAVAPDQGIITAPDTTTKVDPTIPVNPAQSGPTAGPDEVPAEDPAEPPVDLPAETTPAPTHPGNIQVPEEPETPTDPSGVPVEPVESPAPAETPDAPAETPAEPEVPAEQPAGLAAVVDQIYAACPVPLRSLATQPIDLTMADTVSWLTGVTDATLLAEAVLSEPMMGSQAYSLVLVRVNDAANSKDVAQMMLDNIDPAKWICVCADDIDVGIKDDMVLFVMIDSMMGLPAADVIGGFKTVCGGNLDAELSK